MPLNLAIDGPVGAGKSSILKTLCGHLVITGQRLSLTRYDRDGLVVLGKIEKLSYRPKG